MIVRKLRLKRGWTQSQLAEMTGLTTRTIQRIEQGHKPGLESCKALAAVFEVDLSLFQHEDADMNNDTELKMDEQAALLYAKRMKAFYEGLVAYGVCFVVFLFFFPDSRVVHLVLAGVGVGLAIQGLVAYEIIPLFSPDWERKLAERKLGRKL